MTAADIVVGAVNTAGDRTGMKLLQDTRNQFSFTQDLIAPVFCTQTRSPLNLSLQAEALGAITYIDAPIGTTFQQVLAGRGREAINFNTSSDRARLCYPYVKVYDSATKCRGLPGPLSPPAPLACVPKWIWKRLLVEQLQSGSQGITGVEALAVSDDRRSAKRSSQLNENGITTIFSSYTL